MKTLSTYNRANPYFARLKERTLLNNSSSTKKTYHLSLDLSQEELPFTVGDSIAVLPENDPALVSKILKHLKQSGGEKVFDPKTTASFTLQKFLQTKANLVRSNSNILKLLHTRGEAVQPLLENREKLNLFLQSHSLLDILHTYPKAKLDPQELIGSLMPLMPRFYSIASSPKVFTKEIHLTVSYLTYTLHGEARHGVASHFLCTQAELESTPIPIYVQPSHGFSLPDPDASIILIGPGTGVAPFRAFLQERLAQNAKGRNWLFFGERNRASDFYYEPFFTQLEKQNFLRLDTAFSRDQAEKVYVQHKLEEQASSIWDWLQTGAFLYVCGNADKMAKDVDAALQKIAREQGNLSEEEARLYLKKLRAEKRYLLDVY
jgi:sulfite reductase (NADPH) flavoprotein alpha-component